MTVARTKYEYLFTGTRRFTTSTRSRLERAVGRALFGYRGGQASIRLAVRSATQELRAGGVADAEILSILAAVVEDAGRACRADRSSLMSGMPIWVPVQARVIEEATRELAT